MAKKIKKYADGGETMSDVMSGNFPAARRFKEGYEQMPEALKDPMLGLSVGKAARPKFSLKDIDNFYAQEEAKAQARFAANKAARQAEIDQYAKNKALESAKDQQRRALKKANMAGKEPPVREGRVNPYKMQEPGVSYRPLDHKDVMRYMGEFKKGGKVKCMSKGGFTASKRADGIATKGKTRGRII